MNTTTYVGIRLGSGHSRCAFVLIADSSKAAVPSVQNGNGFLNPDIVKRLLAITKGGSVSRMWSSPGNREVALHLFCDIVCEDRWEKRIPAYTMMRQFERNIAMWPFRRRRIVNRSDRTASGDSHRVLSILEPWEVEAFGGIPWEAVAGVLDGEGVSIEAFQPNLAFADFLHQVIRTAGPEDPALQAAAIQQENGWVYIIDLRTPDGPQGRVLTEDIIGAFEVHSGRIVPGSYWRNDQHLVFTVQGLVQLPPSLREAFVRELERTRKGKAEQKDRADAKERRDSS